MIDEQLMCASTLHRVQNIADPCSSSLQAEHAIAEVSIGSKIN